MNKIKVKRPKKLVNTMMLPFISKSSIIVEKNINWLVRKPKKTKSIIHVWATIVLDNTLKGKSFLSYQNFT